MNLNKLLISRVSSTYKILNQSKKLFRTSSFNLASKEFEDAKARLSSLKEDPGNDAKLKLYALFKQATVGACNIPKPGMMDFVGKAKWTAWNQLGKISQEEAEKKYIEFVDELCKSAASEPVQQSSSKFKEILTSIEYGTVYKIVLNRPNKRNALNLQMYVELQEALKEADSNPNILLCCITGAGDFYCAGNDLSNFTEGLKTRTVAEMAKEGRDILESFVNSFINFSKPLIGIVNGPSVGISFTLLGLFDLVYAIDKATFHAPFSKLGQSPEACSSYTFPRSMGLRKASDILIFNRQLTAFEAYERGIVSEIVSTENFEIKVWNKIESFSKLPKNSVILSKKLIRDGEKEILRKINKEECDLLMERWQSDEFMNAIMAFFGRKSK